MPIAAPCAFAQVSCSAVIVASLCRPWGLRVSSRAFAQLMSHLSYERYGAQGSDLGALIAPELAHLDTEHVTGIHLNAASAGFIPFGEIDQSELGTFTGQERARLERLKQFLSPAGNAYFQMHAYRAQMISYPLTDHPPASSPGPWTGWPTGPTARSNRPSPASRS